MASYIASSAIWSTCNSGSAPANGDEITIGGIGTLYMDQDSAVGETFTVIASTADHFFDLAGYSYDGDILLAAGTLLYGNGGAGFSGGDIGGAVTVTGDGVEIALDAGSITGSVDADGHSVTWTGTGSLVITTGTLDLGTGSASGISVEIDATGTVTAGADIECGSFTLTANTYDPDDHDITINGNLSLNAGTLVAGGTWTMASSGTIVNASGNQVDLIVPATVVVTLTGNTFVRSLTGTGSFVLGNLSLYVNISNASGDNKWTFTGDVTSTGSGRVLLYAGTTDAANGSIDIDVPLYIISNYDGSTLTIPLVKATTLFIYTGVFGRKVSLSTPYLETGEVKLGSDAADTKSGGLVLTGVAKIASFKKGTNNIGANTLALNSAYVECSGLFDGDGITVTAVADTTHIMGKGTGTIQNVSVDTQAHAHDFATYGSGATANTNVTEDEWATVGSSSLMGTGV